ncbi:hypothetical protein CLV01_3232 [Delftia sp. 60]|nr:hypothetical protein CLU98_3217 [Burkholderiales bacterium 23]PIF66834.1 hypothetical protein CLV01_3232 [Delftia sp. 60]
MEDPSSGGLAQKPQQHVSATARATDALRTRIAAPRALFLLPAFQLASHPIHAVQAGPPSCFCMSSRLICAALVSKMVLFQKSRIGVALSKPCAHSTAARSRASMLTTWAIERDRALQAQMDVKLELAKARKRGLRWATVFGAGTTWCWSMTATVAARGLASASAGLQALLAPARAQRGAHAQGHPTHHDPAPGRAGHRRCSGGSGACITSRMEPRRGCQAWHDVLMPAN